MVAWNTQVMFSVKVQKKTNKHPHYIISTWNKQHVTLSEFASVKISSAFAKLSEKLGAAGAGEELKEGTPEVNLIVLSQTRCLSAW